MRARAPLLEVTNLQVRFHTEDGTVKAVNGVDITLPAGSTLGIVGESGCGKSVTSLAILRLVTKPAGRISGGSVRLNGKELLELKDDEMRAVRGRDVAMIFQDPMTSLNPVSTIGEQIEEVLKTHRHEHQAGRAACDRVDVGGRHPGPERRVKDYPHQLSGGMRQRHDRHGHRLPADPAHRRRADNRPRRHDSGADPGPDARAWSRRSRRPHPHHPRPGVVAGMASGRA